MQSFERFRLELHKIIFMFRMNLGHMQQGGSPTPFDRNLGTKMGAKTVEWISRKVKESLQPDGTVCANTPDSAVLLGVIRRQYKFTPLEEIVSYTNFEYESVKI